MDTTRRRLASISCCLASRPTASTRVRRRLSRRLSSIPSSSARSSSAVAATPASLFMARSISSAAVSSGTLPISFRYMRTGSPVSMTAELPSDERRRTLDAREEESLGRLISDVDAAFSSFSGIPSRSSSSERLASTSLPSSAARSSPRDSSFRAPSSISISSVFLAFAAATDAILSPHRQVL